MISELNIEKRKDLLFYAKLKIIIQYLPKIIAKIQQETPNKDIEEIYLELIKESKIRLSDNAKEKVLVLLKGSTLKKSMSYKTYKKYIELKLKKKKSEKKLFQDNNKLENFFVSSKTLSNGLNELKKDEELNMEIKKATAEAIKEYIDGMLSIEEIRLVRRKK